MRTPRRPGFTLVEIMIVVLVIAILLAIAIPNFISARETARAKTCANNLRGIDYAVQQYALVNQMPPSAGMDAATWSNSGVLWPTYIRYWPTCPEQGTYAPGPTVITAPTCSISVGNPDSSYQRGGRFYHGMF